MTDDRCSEIDAAIPFGTASLHAAEQTLEAANLSVDWGNWLVESVANVSDRVSQD